MTERPVRLFVPPDAPEREPVAPPPMVSIPERPTFDQQLHAGVAVLGHAGRITDKVLITALGWTPGDRLVLDISHDAVTLTRSHNGTSEVDARGQVIIPVSARRRLQITTGDRVLLVALPEADQLKLHPMHLLLKLLASYYHSHGGADNDNPHATD
jgi:hypothetical protein